MTRSSLLIAGLLLGGFAAADDTKPQDAQKLREENLKLRETLVATQEKLLEITKQLEDVRQQARNAQVTERLWRSRAEKMEEQLRELSREIAQLRIKGGDRVRPVDAGRENYPRENVEGRITDLDAPAGLLRLSIGGDAGLERGHHLKLFRIAAKLEDSKYLGVIEIVSVSPREAVARSTGRLAVPARVGDRVSSRVNLGPFLEKK